jgi:hypothetical protein
VFDAKSIRSVGEWELHFAQRTLAIDRTISRSLSEMNGNNTGE